MWAAHVILNLLYWKLQNSLKCLSNETSPTRCVFLVLPWELSTITCSLQKSAMVCYHVYSTSLWYKHIFFKKTGNCPSRINREVACTTFAKLNATHFFLPFFFLGTCPESSKRASPGNDRPVLYHPKKEHHMSHANQNGTGVLEEPVNKKYLRWHFGLFFQQITIQNVWRHHLGKKKGLEKGYFSQSVLVITETLG